MEADRQPATIFIMRGQNVRYSEIFTESGRTGHDPIADVRSKALLVTALRPSTVIRALPKRAESGH